MENSKGKLPTRTRVHLFQIFLREKENITMGIRDPLREPTHVVASLRPKICASIHPTDTE